MLHRTRHLFIRQQSGVERLLEIATDANDTRLPQIARTCIVALGAQLRTLKAQILEFDRRITAWHRSNETSKRLDQIPGVGPALATALVATVADPKIFRSGRDFSAWIGLVPNSVRVVAKTNSAASVSTATAIYAVCSRPERSRSSATRKSMAPSIGLGLRHCSPGAQPRSLPLRWQISSRRWHGQCWQRVSATRNLSRLRREIAPDIRCDVKLGGANST
jgi:transposase